LSNLPEPGRQQLMDSIFDQDSDTDLENRSVRESSANLNTKIVIPFTFQILTAKSSAENSILLEQEVIHRLHENYKRAKEDFQLTIETILRYLQYNMSFKSFFIVCESAPYTHYDALYKIDKSVKENRESIISGSKRYLNNLCHSMFKFLKQLSSHYQLRANFDMDALEDLFPEVPISDKSIFLETLNKPEVLNSIFSISREEELLLNISKLSFKNYKHQLIDKISDNVIENSDKSPDWILSNDNIRTILSNLTDFNVSDRKITDVRRLVKNYISVENPLQNAKHSYHTRSKEVGAPRVSYFGQALKTEPGNKGSRKRAISNEEISSTSNQTQSSRAVKIARSSLPDEEIEVVKVVVPVSVNEDVVRSKKVESTFADAVIDAKDQRSIEAPPHVEDDEKMEVVKVVVPVSVI